jgi:hypothetical protein
VSSSSPISFFLLQQTWDAKHPLKMLHVTCCTPYWSTNL